MIELLGQKYELIRDDDCFDKTTVVDLVTDYFLPYDYICGDYSYGRVRLKGFYDSKNKNVKKINDIKNLDTYINDYCAYGATIFLLKKKK